MNTYIKAISYYLPEDELTNDDLATLFPEWGVEKVAKKIGISTRHIAATDEFASDMAIAAANKLFTEHGIEPSRIDFILYCTQSPDYFLPTTSCIIQEKLGIPVHAGALDFNLGCSGFVYGLALAKGLLAAGIAENILLITSETYSKFLHPGDKGNRTIFGDAAAATLISTDGFASIEQFVLGTNGKGAENLIVKEGGVRHPLKQHEEKLDEYGNMLSPGCLYMNGPEIFTFTSEEIPPLIDAVLAKHKLIKDDINLFVFHQANKYMLDHLRRKIDITEERFFTYMDKVGNTVSSTIPIALYEAMSQQKNKANDCWLLAGFGVGYSWGGTIIKFIQ